MTEQEIRDFIERLIGFYQADLMMRGTDRRRSQIIALAEVLRFMDGHPNSFGVDSFAPIGLADLEPSLGGDVNG